MNNSSKGLPKIDIIVFKVDYDAPDKTQDAFRLIRTTHASMGYPFGFSPKKLTMHGPFQDGYKIVVYATVRMNIDQYLRKCANSESDALKQTCANWIKVNAEDKMSYFFDLCVMYDKIRAANIIRAQNRKV